MEAKLTKEAKKGREELSEDQWAVIKIKIKSLTSGLQHPDLKLVPNKILDHPIWQLTLDEKEANHRVYLDVRNSTLVVLAIWSFEFTH